MAPAGTIAQTGVSRSARAYFYTCPDPCQPTFTDVSVDHPFFWEIEIAKYQGTANGFSDGAFRPSASISRQAMAAFLYNIWEIEDPDLPSTPTFSDVLPSHPFYEEIEWMAAAGIAGGFSDGTFRPAAPVTRQSMSAFLYRASDVDSYTPSGGSSFTDVAVDAQFRTEIEWMAEYGVTTGYPGGTFRPLAPVTRQAMAAFLLRFAPFTPYG
jgi:hypothetical protein